MELAYNGDQMSCSTRLEISTPGRRYGCMNITDIVTPTAKELDITFHPDIRIDYVTTIQNRHSETVDRVLISQNSILGLKFRRGACVLVHRLSYTLGRTWIFVCLAIETAREAPIQNQDFEPAPKFLSESVVAGCRCDRIRTPLLSNEHNFLLKLGITFRPDIGIAYVTTIRNKHSETVDRALVS
ncbi:hypothetical protein Taro_045444 [Colocasia esculenta]|uniref:Uncharacterized protein n=1 Tax=Colocasia esculenta TaxID=4460 RepID=A0A843WX33_COLES|nr:hypothetical protein [Colocasia esculenta]